MAKSVSLPNGRFWKTQTAALGHFKNMLRRHADEQTVEDYIDHDDLVALLERYDAVIVDGPAKIGRGIDYFFRRKILARASQHRAFGYAASTAARPISVTSRR